MVKNNEKQASYSFMEIMEADVKEKKRQGKIAKWLEKHKRTWFYIADLEVFHINKIYNVMKDSREKVDKKTLSYYLETLYSEGKLDLEIIPRKSGNPYHLYSIKNIDPEKLERHKSKLKAMNLEEEQKDNKPIREGESYKSSMKQSKEYKQAEIDRAEEKRLEIEKSNIQKLKDSEEWKKKSDHTAAKRKAQRKKEQKAKEQKAREAKEEPET